MPFIGCLQLCGLPFSVMLCTDVLLVLSSAYFILFCMCWSFMSPSTAAATPLVLLSSFLFAEPCFGIRHPAGGHTDGSHAFKAQDALLSFTVLACLSEFVLLQV